MPCSRFSPERMDYVFVYIHKKELEAYKYINDNVERVKICENIEYQNAFSAYYHIGRNRIMMNAENRIRFYQIFEALKNNIGNMNNQDCFGSVLYSISNGLINVALDSDTLPFLCSALIHTIRPTLPIWDPNILYYFKIPNSMTNINDYAEAYSNLQNKCGQEITGQGECNDWFQTWNDKFDKRYRYTPFRNFTKIKILDLFFWKEKYVKQRRSQDQNHDLEKYIDCLFSENDEYIEYILKRALIDKSLKLLCEGLAPYVRSQMPKEDYNNMIEAIHNRYMHDHDDYIEEERLDINIFDASELLRIIQQDQQNLFDYLEIHMDIITKLRKNRHRWAHQNSNLNICQTLNNAMVLLDAVGAREQGTKIERMLNKYRQHIGCQEDE